MRLRGSNLDAPFTGEQLSEMKYTRQVRAVHGSGWGSTR